MDLRQMEYFLAVADEQHFTRAAETTRISQSGLSAAIRALEEELGASLFARTTRRVQLTDAGLALLPHARAVLADAASGRDAVAAVGGRLTGELAVGAEQCLGVVDIADVLERYHRRNPSVAVRFEQAGTDALVDRLRSGQLDVALVAFGGATPPPGITMPAVIATEPLVVLGAPGGPLGPGTRLEWQELADREFVDFAPGQAARTISDAVFRRRSIPRSIAFTVNDVHLLLDLVRRGMGLAVVPRPIALKPQAAGLTVLRFADETERWSVGAALGRRTGSAARDSFLELLDAGAA